jgi:hypothetical protein
MVQAHTPRAIPPRSTLPLGFSFLFSFSVCPLPIPVHRSMHPPPMDAHHFCLLATTLEGEMLLTSAAWLGYRLQQDQCNTP